MEGGRGSGCMVEDAASLSAGPPAIAADRVTRTPSSSRRQISRGSALSVSVRRSHAIYDARTAVVGCSTNTINNNNIIIINRNNYNIATVVLPVARDCYSFCLKYIQYYYRTTWPYNSATRIGDDTARRRRMFV